MIKFFLGMSFDASGAYRCYNLKKIKRNDILLAKDNGYSFFWESIFILYKKNYSIFEVPIVLPYRKIGSSKMKVRDILYAFIYLSKSIGVYLDLSISMCMFVCVCLYVFMCVCMFE